MSMSTGGGQPAATGRRPAKRKDDRGGRPSPPRSRLQVDERRAQLLELGAELFSAHSYDGLSVDDIAQAAGISKGLLYHYFPSKREFYVETVRAAADQLLRETRSANEADPALPPLDRARRGIEAYLDYADRHASAFSTLLRGGIGSDLEVFDIIESVRRYYVDRFMGQIDFLDPTPQLRNAMRGYLGYSEGVTLDWLEHGDVPKEEVCDLLVEVLENTVSIMVARQKGKRQTSE
ncbi:MAG: TetR/AcrR family transcriptional regulator [Myxococcota bacterium]